MDSNLTPLAVPQPGVGEAPIDPGASESHQSYTEKDYEGHRAHTMYVGLHVPGSGGRKRSHHRRHRHHHRHHPPGIAEEGSIPENANAAAIPPSARVQFILGEEWEHDTEHESHPLFSEMEELLYNHEGGEAEWNETARWVKFEEDVEEGGSRWSKPHVATLSLHSLFELRSLILNGTVLLDAEAFTLGQIADLVVDSMVNTGHLPSSSKDKVREALLKRHRHLYEKHKETSAAKLPIIRSLADIGRNYSTSRNMEKRPVQKSSSPGTAQAAEESTPLTASSSKDGKGPSSYLTVLTGSLIAEESCPRSQVENATPNSAVITVTVTDTASGDTVVNDSFTTVLSPTTGQMEASHKFERFLSVPESTCGSHQDSKSHHQAVPIATSPSSGSIARNPSGTDVGNGDVHKGNTPFLKKIPPGAEASNVLVGEVDFLEKPVSAFIRLSNAFVLGDLTEVPVPTRFIFILLGPLGGQASYHEVGRAMATLMSDEVFHEVAYRARNRDHLLAGVDEFLDAVTVLPPGEWDPNIRIEPPAAIPSQDTRKFPEKIKEEVNEEEEEAKIREQSGLIRTGRLFGGFVNDIKRKAPWFISDFKDGLSVQCVATLTFMYFACLTPLITFGGLLSDATGNHLGAMESLCSGFLCGIVYGFFAGQPLTILGSTGPVLVFETIVYSFCTRNGLDYMALRLWIGVWIGIILIILVAVDASALVCYITRFTEENFALLIATIFIYKAVEKVLLIGYKFPLEPHSTDNCSCTFPNDTDLSLIGTNFTLTDCEPAFNGTLTGHDCYWVTHPWQPNVFLMSIILCVATYYFCVTLRAFKTSNFFPTSVRKIVSDFGVFITICSMAGIDTWAGVHTPKLMVPAKFEPTKEGRSWFVDPFTNPWWTIPAALAPALLATILIFMDQQITAVIVNRRENKLKKGCGYHLDLFVLAVLIILKSFLGLPWFVAATVLSLNHVNSLKLQSECAAPGEKPKFLGVMEQRVTLILISLLIGLSVFMTPVLAYIPMPVLYGVFLVMGVSPLADMQFYDRILLAFMPTKYQPDYTYLRKVELRRVHLFTFIQFICFVLLWVVKTVEVISIAFPLMLVVMIGVRKSLDFIFTKYELRALDDLMPESTKKHKEQDEDEENPKTDDLQMTDVAQGSRNLQITLPNGNIMNIPVEQKSINISEEVNRSGVWKTVNCSNVVQPPAKSGAGELTCRNNRRKQT